MTALGTSGYLNEIQEGNEILTIIMDGTKLSDVKEINNFETFIETLGVGNSNFDRDFIILPKIKTEI